MPTVSVTSRSSSASKSKTLEAQASMGSPTDTEEHPGLDVQSFVRDRDVSDCYTCLAIQRSADLLEIKNAFRRVALIAHPLKAGNDVKVTELFLKCCESYEILRDANLRGIYDVFGYDGLRHGLPPEKGVENFNGWQYHGDPMKTFNDFFGSENVFEELFRERLYDSVTGIQSVGFQNLRPKPTQSAPIVTRLSFTLEEIYSGTVRRVVRQRKLWNETNGESRVEQVLSIVVPPGTFRGSKFTFVKAGDEGPNIIPSDLQFIVDELPHPLFSRDTQNNLIMTSHVTLSEALTGAVVKFCTLDYRALSIAVPEIITPEYVKIVSAEGMPIMQSESLGDSGNQGLQKGNLMIMFKIKFPRYLDPAQKIAIKATLANSESQMDFEKKK